MWMLLLGCDGSADAMASGEEAVVAPEAPVQAAPPARQALGEAFPPPSGAERVPGDAFGEWLGDLVVLAPDVPVRTYTGGAVGHDARVIELPLVDGDLQQCADSAIRLRAEWLRE